MDTKEIALLLAKWRARAYSFSQHSSWEWNPEQWYARYILGLEGIATPELSFGKTFAQAAEARTPLAPITLLETVEKKYSTHLDDIELIGYADTYAPLRIGEFKTGVNPWSQQKVDDTKQLTFYCLMEWLIDKVKPGDIALFLEWVPTKKIPRDNGDFSGFDYDIAFASDPPEVRHFITARSMRDILMLATEIKATRKEMEKYAIHRLSTIPT